MVFSQRIVTHPAVDVPNECAKKGGKGLIDSRFACQCLNDTLEGLCDGLSHFSGQSRAAVIYMLAPGDGVSILDPRGLLRGHEPILEEIYLDRDQWLHDIQIPSFGPRYGHLLTEKNLKLAGLISCGGRSKPVFYQMWFTEHHPDMCSTGPTERWLEHAAWRFSHDMANDSELYTGISGSFLREYAAHAVRDYIVDQMNLTIGWDTPLRIFPILDVVLGISNAKEEGAWPRGRLVFIETNSLEQLEYVARFPANEMPALENIKHVRKLLLAVERSSRVLVSDGGSIVGIADGAMPDFSLGADFRGQYGYMEISGEPICSFSDGNFNSTTHRANLVQVEEMLLESEIDPDTGNSLFQIVVQLVHYAQARHFGCTIVIDLGRTPIDIAGHTLEHPINLRDPRSLRLAQALLKVDGAVHICRDIQFHGFACLLDGHTVDGEDRSRGARFNSALRFTAAHPGLIVVVVSADRFVSVIQEGVEISAQCSWPPAGASCDYAPRSLKDWLIVADQWPDKG
jgi:hypothetical protein